MKLKQAKSIMYKSRLASRSKSSSRKESKQITLKSRDLSMKSRSNSSSDMSVDDQKPSYDSLIHKSEINESEEIKAEDSYEESDINNLKEHIIHNDSDENYEENSEENEDNSHFIFPKSKISQKDIKEIGQANHNAGGSASELTSKIL